MCNYTNLNSQFINTFASSETVIYEKSYYCRRRRMLSSQMVTGDGRGVVDLLADEPAKNQKKIIRYEFLVCMSIYLYVYVFPYFASAV